MLNACFNKPGSTSRSSRILHRFYLRLRLGNQIIHLFTQLRLAFGLGRFDFCETAFLTLLPGGYSGECHQVGFNRCFPYSVASTNLLGRCHSCRKNRQDRFGRVNMSKSSQVIISEYPTPSGQIIGRLTLNRPASLNSLTAEMIESLTQQLLLWRTHEQVVAVVLMAAVTKHSVLAAISV